MSEVRLIDANALEKTAIPCEIHNGALTELCIPLYQIRIAPTVTPDMAQVLAYECGKASAEQPTDKPVIKCKECKHQIKEWREDRRMKEKGYWTYGCKYFGDLMGYWGFGGNDNEFCSEAEQRDEQEAENE